METDKRVKRVSLDSDPDASPCESRATLEMAGKSEDAREVLERIHKRRQARGAKGRTRQEIDEEIQLMRDEW